MPGFLSEYEGTEQIDLGGGYWVEVKKCLSRAEMAHMEAVMGGRQRVEVKEGGHQFAELDTGAGRTELVVWSLVAWNLDDPDGTIWPLDGVDKGGRVTYPPGCLRRQSVGRLPGKVFDQIWKVCNTLNGQKEGPAAQAAFPGPDELGDPDGDGSAAGAGPVPDGAGVLAEAGLGSGDPGGPPAPAGP